MSPLPSTVLKILYTLLASLQQPLSAVSYSNLLNFKILGNQGGLGAAMMDPGRAEQQLRISSNRTHCPHCAAQLREPCLQGRQKAKGHSEVSDRCRAQDLARPSCFSLVRRWQLRRQRHQILVRVSWRSLLPSTDAGSSSRALMPPMLIFSSWTKAGA